MKRDQISSVFVNIVILGSTKQGQTLKLRGQRALPPLALIVLAVTLTGCANLKAVSDFSTSGAEVMTDVQKSYASTNNVCDRMVLSEQIRHTSLSAELCVSLKNVLEKNSLRTKAIQGYLQAMAALAKDGEYKVDKSLDELAEKASAIGLSDASSIANIIKPIANAFIYAYQKKVLKEVIVARNADFATLADAINIAMQASADQIGAYKEDREKELGFLEDQLKSQRSKNPEPPKPIARVPVEYAILSLKKDIASLKEFKDASAKLAKGVSELKTKHQKLAADSTDISSKDIIVEMRALYDTIKEARKAFEEANGGEL